MSAAPPGPMREEPIPPSLELEAIEDAIDEFMPGKGEGENGMDAADSDVGSKAGEEPAEMDCLRTDLKASDVAAAILAGVVW